MKKSFERIILFARQHRASKGVSDTLLRLVDFLKDQKVAAFAVEEMADMVQHANLNVPILRRDELSSAHDLMVVVGGDGSLLEAAHIAIAADIPVIGINRGRLGFLTDIPPDDISGKLSSVIAGHYQEECRFLLNAKILFEESICYESGALNDIVLSRGREMHLIDFELYINQQYVCHYRADGLIVSTPTGSTAYALSAGGPILHPQLNALVIVPMFPHTLSSRPLVIEAQSEVNLVIGSRYKSDVILSCDGLRSYAVKSGSHAVFKQDNRLLRLLHPDDYHYFDTLRSKLGWQSKQI